MLSSKLRSAAFQWEQVEQVIAEPEQVLEQGNRKVAQTRYIDRERQKEFLIRLFYEEMEGIRL